MQNERKKLEELNLLDDFLFNAMMTYPEMGEKFTRKILKLLFNKEFRNLKVIAQKSYGGLNTDLREPWRGRTPCRENKETKFVLKVF